MAIVRVYTETNADGSVILGRGVYMWCPGCDDMHRIRIAAEDGSGTQPLWIWDGNEESPTISPSILVHSQRFTCHSFVVAGQWQYLSDCTHSLSGTTVPMVDLPKWFDDQA